MKTKYLKNIHIEHIINHYQQLVKTCKLIKLLNRERDNNGMEKGWGNFDIVSVKEKKNRKLHYISIPKENSYCRRKCSARGPRFKVSSKGLSAEIDILQRSPIQVQTKADVA